MKALWVTRSFLDYRVPVYDRLACLLNGDLTLIYNAEVVPDRVRSKANRVLANNAIGLTGEWRIGPKVLHSQAANATIRVPWQPGIVEQVRRRRPDVLITDGFFQWTAPALWVRIRDKVPHVMCYERTAHSDRNAQWFRKLYRGWALRYVDAMCCNGRLCAEYSRQMGVPAARITLGHMAADTEGLTSAAQRIAPVDTQAVRRRLGIQGVCFLYVGKLIILKGLRCLLSAWSRLDPERSAKASLLLVGDGPDRPFLEEFRRANDLRNIHFAGAVDYDNLAPYYASADAFVMPTLEDNWSLVIPEAMACGLPVLCSKYNGCWPELAQEGRNGWVFDPLDTPATSQLLGECIRNAARLPLMGKESRIILQDHTPQRAAEAILRACQIACAQHRQ